MFRATLIMQVGFAVWLGLVVVTNPGVAQDSGDKQKLTTWLQEWSFLIGEWALEEKRYGFDGVLIQTNVGQAHFRWVMDGQRIEEVQTIVREDGQQSDALHVFVYDPRSEEVEIARTDSGHYGFWVILGKPTSSGMELAVKYPNPQSDVTRRVTYTRAGKDGFSRQLEFSTDDGKTFFVRSEWTYTRK